MAESFTLQEAMIIYTSLTSTVQGIEQSKHRIVKEQGTDPYDLTLAAARSALSKIQRMAEAGIDEAREKETNHDVK